tara:strand:+ start:518 stop:694 length:177 start_codon:yes stop_codon:yes gene_type:complete
MPVPTSSSPKPSEQKQQQQHRKWPGETELLSCARAFRSSAVLALVEPGTEPGRAIGRK